MVFGDYYALILSSVAKNSIAWNNGIYIQQQLKDNAPQKRAKKSSVIKTICDNVTPKNNIN